MTSLMDRIGGGGASNLIIGLVTLALVIASIVQSCNQHSANAKLIKQQSIDFAKKEQSDNFINWISKLNSESYPEKVAAIAAISELAINNKDLRRLGREALYTTLYEISLACFKSNSSKNNSPQNTIAETIAAQKAFIAVLKLDPILNEPTIFDEFMAYGISLNDLKLYNVKLINSQLVKLSIIHVEAKNISFKNSDLNGFQLSMGSNLDEVDYSKSTIYNASFIDSEITNAQFVDTIIKNKSELERMKISCALFYKTIMNEGIVAETTFDKTSLDNSEWTDTKILNTKFINSSLCDMKIDKSEIRNIKILEDSIGSGAKFINVQAWNIFIDAKIDMTKAEFSGSIEHFSAAGVYLKDSIFNNAILNGAVFRGSDLRRTQFKKDCKLKYANFEYANLTDAKFGCADLDHARFSGADLRGADLSHVRNLQYAELAGSLIDKRTKLPNGFDLKKVGLKNIDNLESKAVNKL